MTVTFEPPPRHPWMDDALCATHGLDLWFPEGNTVHMIEQQRQALEICRQCPVRTECLDYALSLGYGLDGIWGATTSADRKALLRQLGRTA